jgi:hypothetical protein
VTPLGLLLLGAAGTAFILWLLNLVRLGRLYVGYAVLLIAALVGGAFAVGVAPIRRFVAGPLEALFPATGPLLAVVALLLVALVYLLTQLTIVSNRLAALVQELAISSAGRDRARREPTAEDGRRHDSGGA